MDLGGRRLRPSRRLSTSETESKILAALGSTKRKHTLIEQLPRALKLPTNEIQTALEGLESKGQIIRTRKGRVALPARLGMVTGRVVVNRRGRAVVRPIDPDDPAGTIGLGRRQVRPAMDGDLVLVEPSPYARHGRPSGRIERILERGRSRLTAVMSESAPETLIPTDPRVGYPAQLTPGAEPGPPGEVLECEITAYPTSYRNLELRPLRSLGPRGQLATEIEAVCSMMSIATGFPADVVAEAEACREPSPADIKGRLDLRSLTQFTVDPSDAADHDDAVGIEATEDGWRLTVSIADVSHYVRPGTGLDEEARRTTTSTYFPGRAVHMLPEVLSAGVASLVPDRDRLAISVTIDITPDGKPTMAGLAKTVIRSHAKLSYQAAQDILDAPNDHELAEALVMMKGCAAALRSERMARGAIDLDLPEGEVALDDKGQPTGMHRVQRLTTHRIIEEFMLVANEAVASHLTEKQHPLLYRVHERPDQTSVNRLAARLSLLGLRLPREGALREPAALAAVVNKARGKPFERIANIMVLRAMAQARYAAEQAIHFGLASQCYTHFTSPIRRYPDIVVHRALGATLGMNAGDAEKPSSLRQLGIDCSQSERRSMEAERDVVRAAGIMIMAGHVGDSFQGTITSVERFGFFVELDEMFVEGLVPLGRLEEYYEFRRERLELISRSSGRTFKIGQRLTVRVTSAELGERSLELEPLD